jgi:hypothetical protein
MQVDGQCVTYNNWRNHNINYIQDIIGYDGKILSKRNLERKYNIISIYLEYETLVHAIPKTWEKTLIEHKTLNANYYIFKECTVGIQGKRNKLEEIDTRQLVSPYG